jgi:cell division cycle 20, cofactor of APC complex
MGEGAGSQSLQCWNVNSNELKSSIITSSPIKMIQFAPLAKQIVTTHGNPENSIQIHRYPLMKKVATSASNHLDPVSYAAINPRGDVVATGSADETIRFWRFWEPPPRRTWHPSERNIIRSAQMLR